MWLIIILTLIYLLWQKKITELYSFLGLFEGSITIHVAYMSCWFVTAFHIRQRGHCWNSMVIAGTACSCAGALQTHWRTCAALLCFCTVLFLTAWLWGAGICLQAGSDAVSKAHRACYCVYLSTPLLIIAGFDWTALIAKQMPRPSFWESFSSGRRNIENGLIFCWKLHGLISRLLVFTSSLSVWKKIL